MTGALGHRFHRVATTSHFAVLLSLLIASHLASATNTSIPRLRAEAEKGYIEKEIEQIEFSRKRDDVPLPEDIVYNDVPSLSQEAKEKLARLRPVSLGQAARIPGITPVDISVLSLHIAARQRAARYAAKTAPAAP